ncbi:Serine/threonine protein kinase [Geitlerinema sp. FC II]|uniref:hypothetical protein n=1 Tax=Baaleninema simplex TaxID=2862350 RepID=UPI0003460BE5|nr:hypothetical protein [Baaleninema simplex]PPT10860.1 Serine/threonine protein kinase [Geitlerinema sp. FC II]
MGIAFFSALLILNLSVDSVRSQSQLTPRSRVAIDGIGPVRVGMTVAEASRSAGTTFVREGVYDSPQCHYIVPENGMRDVSFMVTNGRIARVDVRNPVVRTVSGAGIGNSEEEIEQLYPDRIEVSRHPYTGGAPQNGHYLTFVPQDWRDRNYRVIFETSYDYVTQYRAGKLPEVEYIEGCA